MNPYNDVMPKRPRERHLATKQAQLLAPYRGAVVLYSLGLRVYGTSRQDARPIALPQVAGDEAR